MATETERRFLVIKNGWRSDIFRSKRIQQGYLSDDCERVVRVRLSENLKSHGQKSVITIKGRKEHGSGLEFEYEIPYQDALQMIALCKRPIIDKVRYIVDQYIDETRFQRWEIDEFYGDNEGLIIAELELREINDEVILPDWVGEEITGDIKYANSNLARHPISQWEKEHEPWSDYQV